MWHLIRRWGFIFLYIIVTFLFGHYSFSVAITFDSWIATNIKFSEILQDIRTAINLDRQIWNLLFAILFPFSRQLLEASLMEASKLKLIMIITLSVCFLINFLGLQLN
jgi:hypothetical protein